MGAPLDHVIDACSRGGAKIDLLIHGAVDTANISALENQIREAALDHHLIRLGGDVIEGIVDNICNHPSLIFLVAISDDAAAKIRIEELIPKRGGRIPVPLVLVEDRPSGRTAEQSAA